MSSSTADGAHRSCGPEARVVGMCGGYERWRGGVLLCYYEVGFEKMGYCPNNQRPNYCTD